MSRFAAGRRSSADRRTKIAITADGQFGQLTGIQHYVDSLLAALYESDTTCELIAFAPFSSVGLVLSASAGDGSLRWLEHPGARIDFGGASFQPGNSSLAKNEILRSLTVRLDRSLSPFRERTARLRARLCSRRFDLLHTASPASPHFDSSEARLNTVTIYDLTTRLHPWAHTAPNIALWERMFDYAKKRCARVLTISQSSKRDIVAHLGILEDRVDVTPLAAKASTARVSCEHTLRDLLGPLGLSNRPFLLYAGTIEPRKNLLRLITAFKRVTADASFPHVLVLAGGAVGQHATEVRRLATTLGLADRVLQTGYVSNRTLNGLMSACDVFVYVSEYEGFGLPPLEAMVCGAPVVSSNVSSLPEVVGDAAIQVSPSDVDGVADAILLLLTNSCENARRRRLSLERAKLFTWQRTAELTLQSYEAVLS